MICRPKTEHVHLSADAELAGSVRFLGQTDALVATIGGGASNNFLLWETEDLNMTRV